MRKFGTNCFSLLIFYFSLRSRYTETDDYVKCQALEVKTAIKALRDVWTSNKQVHPEEKTYLGRLFQVLSKFEYLRSKQLQKEEEESKGSTGGLNSKIVEPKNKIANEEAIDPMEKLKRKYVESYKRYEVINAPTNLGV